MNGFKPQTDAACCFAGEVNGERDKMFHLLKAHFHCQKILIWLDFDSGLKSDRLRRYQGVITELLLFPTGKHGNV